jgi:dipeptidyl aminopeptidase/acylaminoacyl peptidase
MRKIFLFACLLPFIAKSQTLAPLTIDKIMADPKWMGTQPSQPQWNITGDTLYFMWNPDAAMADSLYYVTTKNTIPQKLTAMQKKQVVFASSLKYNQQKTKAAYVKTGDVFLYDVATKTHKVITNTAEVENNIAFIGNGTKLSYQRGSNLYMVDLTDASTNQITNVVQNTVGSTSSLNAQEQWLKNDQQQTFEILAERKKNKDAADAYNKTVAKKELKKIILDDKQIQDITIAPNGNIISYVLYKPYSKNRVADVPNYVSETGFTTNIATRPKVGEQPGKYNLFIYNIAIDSIVEVKLNKLPGLKDIPAFHNNYPKQLEKLKKDSADRDIYIDDVIWNEASTKALLSIYSFDNKDYWLMQLTANGSLTLIDRQTDSAWIGGPMQSAINGSKGWIDNDNCWFYSEKTGYNHLYKHNTITTNTAAITNGSFEVQQAQLSADKKYFYITTNEVHPGEKHLYKQSLFSNEKVKLTNEVGANNTSISPNEKYFANLYSYSNKPWELFLQSNVANAKAIQITNKAQSSLFKSYAWKDPQLVTFKAQDGETVYARLYKPVQQHTSKPAVIFVHGAGYLQNAHKWWSSYFREYMFHNLLADNGYTVLDIDYRASAGYGRNWRTGIYRFMGGKDLSDHVDAANYLVTQQGVNKNAIGIYGGSYGGFITLMGLFTEPNVFAAGAALRPVTNWSNYNHGYTSNILNEPANDSIAYKRSSPLYFANGLNKPLLICHGIIDLNVHYQDVVQLQQKLIELGKDNWEVAGYPVEDHGFKEPSSWTDEYKRIFKLFELNLKK